MSFAQEYQGWSTYAPDIYWGPHRLLVAVPCIVSGLPVPLDALLDTAAEWCMIPRDLAALVGAGVPPLNPIRIHTRFGLFEGLLERLPIQIPAIEGLPLTVDATWFVSADWPGPPVLGWKGCLERFRFALDPEQERFYFGM